MYILASNIVLSKIKTKLLQSCETTPDSEESVLMQLASVPSTGSLSSRSKMSNSAMSILAATVTTKADVVILLVY